MHDAVSEQQIPRSYVHTIWQRLRALQSTTTTSPIATQSPRLSPSPYGVLQGGYLCSRPSTFTCHFTVDISAGLAVRFHGSSSPFTLPSEVLNHVVNLGFDIARLSHALRSISVETSDTLEQDDELDPYLTHSDRLRLSEALVRRDIAWYFTYVNPLYGFVKSSVIADDANQIFAQSEVLQSWCHAKRPVEAFART